MREDFCGTGRLSCQWVTTHDENTAVGYDLDPEPLAYGKKNHLAALTPQQRKRVQLLRKNVLSVSPEKFELVVAGNFSFFIFKKRADLVAYFTKVRQSLVKGGLLVLEMAGGPGMIAKMRERRRIEVEAEPHRGKKFIYYWHQREFDPITHDALYSIHFKLPSGKMMEHAFVYDWRLWTIPEVRDALQEAGFSESAVYWEREDRQGNGTGEYQRQANGDNSFAWIAQVVGIA